LPIDKVSEDAQRRVTPPKHGHVGDARLERLLHDLAVPGGKVIDPVTLSLSPFVLPEAGQDVQVIFERFRR
jgi:hypothetical protein